MRPEGRRVGAALQIPGRATSVSTNTANCGATGDFSEDAPGDTDWDAGAASGGVNTIAWIAESALGGLAGALVVD